MIGQADFGALGFMWDVRVKAVGVLLQHGADVNARDEHNSTPLHLVSSRPTRGIKIARLLLEHGANADAEDEMCRTPSEIASSTPLRVSHKIAQLISDHRNRAREENSS